MKKIFLFVMLAFHVQAQDLKAYTFFNKNGKPESFNKVAKDLANYDIVLFGEHHNNSINHWLQLKLTQALYNKVGKKLILGAEMFERDNQEAITKYLAKNIDDKQLAQEARLWKNHSTDYKPILDFARDKQLKMIASNVPRKYASTVAKVGKDSLILDDSEKKWVVKMPFEVSLETPGYEEMKKMMGEHAGTKALNFVAAQAIKDATMAESILNNFQKGYLMLHFHGDFHSKEYGGIYWYLKQKAPHLKIAVISIAEADADNWKLPEKFIKTEYNLLLPNDMTKTY